MKAKDHPGIYLPPPLLYVVFFLGSLFLQKVQPLNKSGLHTLQAHIIGLLLIGLFILINFMALRRFIVSKNTVVTIKPATSLQTTGIYSVTRNPMYLGLLLLYSGMAIFWGSWWTFILLPFLIVTIQLYVIRKEEQYLHQAFGAPYEAYKKRVRRWI